MQGAKKTVKKKKKQNQMQSVWLNTLVLSWRSRKNACTLCHWHAFPAEKRWTAGFSPMVYQTHLKTRFEILLTPWTQKTREIPVSSTWWWHHNRHEILSGTKVHRLHNKAHCLSFPKVPTFRDKAQVTSKPHPRRLTRRGTKRKHRMLRFPLRSHCFQS